MSISEVLKERRIELNIKQDDLAERLGVTVQTISKWERGINEPKAGRVPQIAKILKLSEREICLGEKAAMSKLETGEFLRLASYYIKHLPETELVLTIFNHVDNAEQFIEDLANSTGLPYQNGKEREIAHAKEMMELYENGNINFEEESHKDLFLKKYQELARA
ncbi:helix-turn-helix domain-containing protein [Vibrio algarum]|uniref:Helix-turn-helix domain-containing protein n=1 Tax=Vibrio algarum TaxID=3020714 RepID=A0ABT4YXS6_9VIBR|nr:helix-turn-helix domain-containing protein [Vibrio sp. KJ40-1]MDB1126280.1 helix-turn-helix domain-containing protein [Vibrio sp. KJ40-1]MDB1126284.1 helix-turn-helix domain-containing protein [Vibrio sp. KJ40-1]